MLKCAELHIVQPKPLQVLALTNISLNSSSNHTHFFSKQYNKSHLSFDMALWQRNECCLICYDATCATLNAMHHTRRKTSLCYCTKVLVQRAVCYFGPVSQAKIKPCLTLYYIASRGLCIVNLFVKDFNLSVENCKMKISMRKSTR